VAQSDDYDQQQVVLHGVDDPIVTDADPVAVATAQRP
jgi:hypothetical protein